MGSRKIVQNKRIYSAGKEESATLYRTPNLRNQFCGAFALEQAAQNKGKNNRSANGKYNLQKPEHGMDCSGVHN